MDEDLKSDQVYAVAFVDEYQACAVEAFDFESFGRHVDAVRRQLRGVFQRFVSLVAVVQMGF